MKILKAVSDPVKSLFYLGAKVSKNSLYARLERLSPQSDRCRFILSFDCDTHEDARVVKGLHDRVTALGIAPYYAVPGQLLEKSASIYQEILQQGGRFINHGYYEHTYFDTDANAYRSSFFYDQLPLETVEEDIRKGDEALRRILGIAPKGYRAPHFGVFQSPNQLRFMHRVLADLGYEYSSSTLPYYAFRYGACFHDFGIAEIPVSGSIAEPMAVLDSWSYFAAPNRTKTPQAYKAAVGATLRWLGANKRKVLLNYYADPSHIAHSEPFFEAITQLALAADPFTYEELI